VKITKSELKIIILEELKKTLEEEELEEIGKLGRYVAGALGGAAMLATPVSAMADAGSSEKFSIGSRISPKQDTPNLGDLGIRGAGAKAPAVYDIYGYDGQIKDNQNGKALRFKELGGGRVQLYDKGKPIEIIKNNEIGKQGDKNKRYTVTTDLKLREPSTLGTSVSRGETPKGKIVKLKKK